LENSSYSKQHEIIVGWALPTLQCSPSFLKWYKFLPNSARRSPDIAWVKLEHWNALTLEEQDGFPPIAPDFVIELISPSDLRSQRYEDLQQKMLEYLENGVRLGWLIEPKAKTVEIYRLGKGVEILQTPKTLIGGDVLPNFTLDLEPIWS